MPNAPAHKSLSVAVVVVCHNYGRFLAQAIESVLAQTLPSTEIVVILDHCSDNSHEVAKRYPVEAIETHACDPYLSRRLGVRSTRSEVLIFLDADDWLSPNYIAEGLPCFEDPDVGIVTGDIQRFGYDDDHIPAEVGDIEVRNCVTSAALVWRSAIEQSRCFEDFSLVGIPSEDWETWKRIVRAGWSITIPAKPITHHHRRHDNNRTLSRLFQHDPWCQSQRSVAEASVRDPPWRKRTIKIGYVSPSAGLGGAETQFVSQIKYARALDWIGVWVPEGAPRAPAILGKLPPLHADDEGLARLCGEADCLYVWGLPALPARIKKLTDAPIIYGVHGEGEWMRKSLADVGELVDLLLCVSHGAIRTIPHQHRNKARLIRGGADLGAVIAQRDREEIRREWGIAPGELAVGYVGRLSCEKNPTNRTDSRCEAHRLLAASRRRSESHPPGDRRDAGRSRRLDEFRLAADGGRLSRPRLPRRSEPRGRDAHGDARSLARRCAGRLHAGGIDPGTGAAAWAFGGARAARSHAPGYCHRDRQGGGAQSPAFGGGTGVGAQSIEHAADGRRVRGVGQGGFRFQGSGFRFQKSPCDPQPEP